MQSIKNLTSAVNWEWPSASFVPHYATGHPITANVRSHKESMMKFLRIITLIIISLVIGFGVIIGLTYLFWGLDEIFSPNGPSIFGTLAVLVSPIALGLVIWPAISFFIGIAILKKMPCSDEIRENQDT